MGRGREGKRERDSVLVRSYSESGLMIPSPVLFL